MTFLRGQADTWSSNVYTKMRKMCKLGVSSGRKGVRANVLDREGRGWRIASLAAT